MDSFALFAIQSPLGLGNIVFGHLYRCVHALCGGLFAQ